MLSPLNFAKIRINNYILESPKLDKSKNIINISDIHSNIEVLKKIRKTIAIYKMLYINSK